MSLGNEKPATPTVSAARRRRRLVLRALVALVPSLLLVAAAEVWVRYRYEEITARPYFLPGIYASADPPRRFTLVPSYEGRYFEGGEVIPTRTNALAMRDPDLDQARRGAERRVLFLGDSITFGRGVRDEESYPRRCEALWREALGGEAGREVACFNAGVPGYDTVQELATLAAVGTAIAPHLVLVGWYRNDVAVPTAEQPASVIEGQLAPDREWYEDWKRRTIDHQENLFDRSMLLRLARYEWKDVKLRLWGLDRRAGDVEDQGDEGGLGRCLNALREIHAWCQAHGARMGVVLFPAREEVEADLEIEPPLMVAVREMCRAEGIEVLDLLQRWRDDWASRQATLYLPRDRCHPNALGHDQVARWVAEAFQPTLRAEPMRPGSQPGDGE